MSRRSAPRRAQLANARWHVAQVLIIFLGFYQEKYYGNESQKRFF